MAGNIRLTKELIDRLEECRERMGMSASGLGISSGLSTDYYRKMREQFADRSQKNIPEETLTKLAKTLETSVEHLVFGDKPRKRLSKGELERRLLERVSNAPENSGGLSGALAGRDTFPEPVIAEFVKKIPPKGREWLADDRVKWMRTLLSLFDYVYGEVEKIEVQKQAANLG
jgi:hypothetical protein